MALNERSAQIKAGVFAILALLGLAMIVPAAGGFADWYNLQNAVKTTADTQFTQLATATYTPFTSGLRDSNYTSPASYYYFYNTSSTSPLNKCNLSQISASTGIANVQNDSTARNYRRYGASGVQQIGDAPNTNGFPYWILYFNFRAWDAYYDNIVRIKLNMTGLHTGTYGNYGDWGKTITLAWSDGTTDMEIWHTSTLQSDAKMKAYIDLDTNELRAAITQFGQLTGYLKLTITHQDCSESGGLKDVKGPIFLGTGVFTYSAATLMKRDDPLDVGVLLGGVIGFVGALLVQPGVSLNDLMGRGRQGKGRGR